MTKAVGPLLFIIVSKLVSFKQEFLNFDESELISQALIEKRDFEFSVTSDEITDLFNSKLNIDYELKYLFKIYIFFYIFIIFLWLISLLEWTTNAVF